MGWNWKVKSFASLSLARKPASLGAFNYAGGEGVARLVAAALLRSTRTRTRTPLLIVEHIVNYSPLKILWLLFLLYRITHLGWDISGVLYTQSCQIVWFAMQIGVCSQMVDRLFGQTHRELCLQLKVSSPNDPFFSPNPSFKLQSDSLLLSSTEAVCAVSPLQVFATVCHVAFVRNTLFVLLSLVLYRLNFLLVLCALSRVCLAMTRPMHLVRLSSVTYFTTFSGDSLQDSLISFV